MKALRWAIVFLLVFKVWCEVRTAWGAAQLLEVAPIQIFQGEIKELKISGMELTTLEAQLGKKTIRFYPLEEKTYAALVGIDLESKPGTVKVMIKGAIKDGLRRDIQIPINVKTKAFRQEAFSVPPQFDDLGASELERIRSEQQQLDRVFAVLTPERMWEPPFIIPVLSEITSPFGYRRIINGTPRAPHTGVDLRAAVGTQVLASNNGRVALTGDFFFSGNTLVLDHGGGLYTMYFHLSEFNKREGDDVYKGEVIGLSGMTGRVTGPHLHWGARINGARVDPFELIQKVDAKDQSASGGDANGREKEE